MDIHTSLYEGQHICLAPIDHDKDAEIESKWTHDPEYLRLLDTAPACPLSAWQLKKKYEAIEKAAEEEKNTVYFTIRTRPSESDPAERLVGFVQLQSIEWTNGNGHLRLGIGDPHDRHKGYGTEALGLILRYAFCELNLYRLTAFIPEYNPVALRLFEKAGFVREVCRRQTLNRDGRRWDQYGLGLLRAEWQSAVQNQPATEKQSSAEGAGRSA